MADVRQDDELTELYSYPGRAKSDVWVHFAFRKDGQMKKLDLSRAICRLCNKSYTNNGNTTNFRTHLMREHPGVLASDPQEEGKRQPKIMDMLPGMRAAKDAVPLTKEKSKTITDAIAEYIVMANQPVSTVESSVFKKLIEALEPRYTMPSRKTLLKILTDRYETTSQRIADEVKGMDVCITHDGWTSLNTESYETVTCSYINDQWQLKCRVLATQKVEGSHTSENIASCLTKVKATWQLGNLVAVTDNASNEIKAFRILSWPRHSCMGHNINLVVNVGLKLVARLVAKGRSIVSYFHRSPMAMGLLFGKQKLLLPKEQQDHKLITDCPTRWNSLLDMLQRLTEQTAPLHALAVDPSFKAGADLKTKLFDFSEQSRIDSVITVLKPFKLATVLLSAEKTPTLSLVLPCLLKMEQCLVVEENDPPVIVQMKEAMAANLQKRFSKDEDMDMYRLASLLDPRTKALGFLKAEERALVRDRLLKRCLEIVSSKPQIKNDDAASEPPPNIPESLAVPSTSSGTELAEPPPKLWKGEPEDTQKESSDRQSTCASTSSSSSWLDDIICVHVEKSRLLPEQLCIREIDRYINEEQQISQNECPLVWWAQKQILYPRVAEIAKVVLAIHASSVPSERIFSLAGNIVTRKRSRLSPENVDMLVFLHKNAY